MPEKDKKEMPIRDMIDAYEAENAKKGIEGLTKEQGVEIGKAICDRIEMD